MIGLIHVGVIFLTDAAVFDDDVVQVVVETVVKNYPNNYSYYLPHSHHDLPRKIQMEQLLQVPTSSYCHFSFSFFLYQLQLWMFHPFLYVMLTKSQVRNIHHHRHHHATQT